MRNITTIANNIIGIYFDNKANDLYLSDHDGKKVLRYSPDSSYNLTLSINVSNIGRLCSITVQNKILYIGGTDGLINMYNLNGNFLSSYTYSAQHTYIWGLNFDLNGNLIYALELKKVCFLNLLGDLNCIQTSGTPVSIYVDYEKGNLIVGLFEGIEIYSMK